ncbi:MAG: DUF5686 family protein [Flavobacteriaceae bacterium]|nr:hypothetical protein [Flavobacteriaceae bacterium]
MKYCLSLLLFFLLTFNNQAQSEAQTDSIPKSFFSKALESGYVETKYFDFDLRYLIKYNQYEGFRTGLGGITNSNLSEILRIEGYTVYGFLDDEFKYSIGTGVRLAKKTNTWLNLNYTDDLQETGSSNFLTDQRFFQLFEPRLINIETFHKHTTKALSIEHQFAPEILTETQFAISNIEPKYKYTYNHEVLGSFENFKLSLLTISAQLSPFSKFEHSPAGIVETKTGFPKFSIQYTRSFADILKSDFRFSKLDFRTIQQFKHQKKALTEFVFTGGLANGDIPITHTYHAYPNNVSKETILQRFSVAGTNSFETMYFNEFYSDKFATLQMKHKLSPLNISPWLKPELVLIYRYAVGSMDHINRHENISFSTLEKGFSEAGLEINKLFFGFGLSFAYRHGAYHLPRFDDNLALKFTFNLNLK